MNAIADTTTNLFEVLPASDARLPELLEREGRIERAQRNAYYEIGLELRAIRDGQLYKIGREQQIAGRYSFLTFEEYVEQRWEMAVSRAFQLVAAADAVLKMSTIVDVLPLREAHVRELLKLETDTERVAVWQEVIRERNGQPVRASDVEAAVERYKAAKSKSWITLEEWDEEYAHPDAQMTMRDLILGGEMGDPKATFNAQDNENIEWARWSWNPVTGCKHDCPYCYARDIANRFYPQKFEPSLHFGRFAAPVNTAVPDKAKTDISYRNVFTCSMADLFGRWVPEKWIEAVLQTVADNPQWNFLFLTKFPKRMAEFEIPENAWMGTTVDCQVRVKAAEDAFERVKCGVKWLSIEPMLEPIKFTRLGLFDWVVIGGASRSTQTPAWTPPLDWMVNLHSAARQAECRIYYKTNSGMNDDLRIREFPWQEPVVQQLPKSFVYLKQV